MRKREKNKIFPAKDFQQISPQRNIKKSDMVKTEKKEQLKEQTKEQIKERGEEEASRS